MPPGIVTLPDDVEGDVSLPQILEEPLRRRPVGPPIDMEHDAYAIVLRQRLLYPPNPGLQEPDEPLPRFRIALCAAQSPLRPEHSRRDLIADLDDVGQNVFRLERRDDLGRIFA